MTALRGDGLLSCVATVPRVTVPQILSSALRPQPGLLLGYMLCFVTLHFLSALHVLSALRCGVGGGFTF